ncbi:multicopper oxidase family protein [Microvirga sp. GCM10011540]|uniref:multicopper oxidase family protein n=1 Tax=Microvirga sp. GCM10011540 TaxID=3317338 RepID=UPI0036217719
MLTRRTVLGGMAGLAGAGALAGTGMRTSPARAGEGLPARPSVPAGRRHDLTFVAAEREARLLGPSGPVSRVWTYTDDLFGVVRMRLGDTLRARLDNRLPEHTSMHWHGIRVPNSQDGVQYLTQPPVNPGETFAYEFTPPDTGTFFFHPHCNETGQVGRGLAGILIVEGDEQEPSHADLVLASKDWRLAEDGSWLSFDTLEGASRAGTFGTVRAVNGEQAFSAEVPAHGDIRLRILNLDATRMIEVGVEGAEAYVIATDGNPITPFPLHSWRLGAAMRLDVLVRAPAAGRTFRVLDYFSAEPWPLATVRAAPSGLQPRPFSPKPLYVSSVPRADLKNAERMSFAFSAATGAAGFVQAVAQDDPLAKVLLDSLCVQESTFWAINKASWPNADHRRMPPPLAMLEAGRSYVFELMNATPHPHPIHLHGHMFEVLSASRSDVPRFLADTVLLHPKERIEIAFVAERGDWMFHCHILEHLEFGMMGYVRAV